MLAHPCGGDSPTKARQGVHAQQNDGRPRGRQVDQHRAVEAVPDNVTVRAPDQMAVLVYGQSSLGFPARQIECDIVAHLPHGGSRSYAEAVPTCHGMALAGGRDNLCSGDAGIGERDLPPVPLWAVWRDVIGLRGVQVGDGVLFQELSTWKILRPQGRGALKN